MTAFAAGCGGEIGDVTEQELRPGDCAFYGVRPGWTRLWEQAKREGRTVYYCDNAYFDSAREKFFRVTRNALQCDGTQAVWSGRGVERFKSLGLSIREWQRNGSHVVVCPQSTEFLQVVAGYAGNWLADAIAEIKKHTDRPLVVRKKGEARPLAEDLKGAHALVTHMSAAAVEALLAGVPVFCTGRSAARWMGTSDLSLIETPVYPDRRQEWAEVLCENQWTLDEMRDGTAWRALNRG